MSTTIAILPGDGIGPEVIAPAARVLEHCAGRYDLDLELQHGLIGGAAIAATGDPLPAETIRLCESAEAALLGAVGDPRWSDPSLPTRPEQGLLRLRRHLDLFANLRPVRVFDSMRPHAPLRSELLDGVDLLLVRELTGGIYFGQRQEEDSSGVAFDTMRYDRAEVERIAHVAFLAARQRGGRVTSVDKANVLASMRLWRRSVTRVAEQYPDVQLEHLLVDACAMYLMSRPAKLDVILAGNCFGDILSDEAAVLAGSLGLLPSACLGTGTFGLYEPIHGSAPDIAGQGIANPIAAILSVALMLRHSLGRDDAASSIERAVSEALDLGLRTADIAGTDQAPCSTSELANAVIDQLRREDESMR